MIQDVVTSIAPPTRWLVSLTASESKENAMIIELGKVTEETKKEPGGLENGADFKPL